MPPTPDQLNDDLTFLDWRRRHRRRARLVNAGNIIGSIALLAFVCLLIFDLAGSTVTTPPLPSQRAAPDVASAAARLPTLGQIEAAFESMECIDLGPRPLSGHTLRAFAFVYPRDPDYHVFTLWATAEQPVAFTALELWVHNEAVASTAEQAQQLKPGQINRRAMVTGLLTGVFCSEFLGLPSSMSDWPAPDYQSEVAIIPVPEGHVARVHRVWYHAGFTIEQHVSGTFPPQYGPEAVPDSKIYSLTIRPGRLPPTAP